MLWLTSSHCGVVGIDEIVERLKMEKGEGGGAFIPFGGTRFVFDCVRMSMRHFFLQSGASLTF